MSAAGFTLFDTAIGACGIAWGARGIVGVQLPERSEAATRARLARRFPGAPDSAPPPAVTDAIRRIVALLAGEASDLSPIALDTSAVPDLNARVYDVARSIPPGETLTYGEIAKRIGEPGEARAVGRALGQNPFPIVVPCHRVLSASGKAGGFSAPGGLDTKMRMLTIERARTGDAPTLFDALPLATRSTAS